MKALFLILAILGAIIPYAFFLQFFSSEGTQLADFISALFANGAAGGFSVDLLISSFVFWLAMFYRHRKKGGPSPALFIALNLLIGLSCALPAYFYAITPGSSASE